MKDFFLPTRLTENGVIQSRDRNVFLIQCRDGLVWDQDEPMKPASTSLGLLPENKVACYSKNTTHGSTCKKRKSCHVLYEQNPLRIVRSSGTFMEDEDGNQLLDCVSGVSQVGHCHPKVIAAAHEVYAQPGIFSDCTSQAVLMPDIVIKDDYNYVERLLATLPANLNKGFVVNSGSEANDLALQMARDFTGNYDVIVFESSFHGCLGTVGDISPKTFNTENSPKDWVTVIPVPDLFRGQFKASDPEALNKYFTQTKEIIEKKLEHGRKFACLISEPIFTFHSLTVPDKGYMQRIVGLVRSMGVLVIMDEVQTGLGRLGTNMWGFQNLEIVPDMLVTGKPLGNGYPLAFVGTSRKIGRCLRKSRKFIHHQFTPSPMQSAMGSAVLDVVIQENLVENATIMGDFIMTSVKSLMPFHSSIADVRGSGLLIGIELVQDLKSMKPAAKLAECVLYKLREERIIVAVEGICNNMLILIPPLCFSMQDAGKFLQAFDRIMGEYERQMLCQQTWSQELQRIGLSLEEEGDKGSFSLWRSKEDQSSGDSGQGSSASSSLVCGFSSNSSGRESPKDDCSDSGSSGFGAYNDLD